MKAGILISLIFFVQIYSQTSFIPNSVIVGEKNGSYIDPEFNSRIGQVVFQDIQNRVWIGHIDKKNGLLISSTGKDYLVDNNINPVFDTPPKKWSTNGPEWTKDNLGDFVVYTKEDGRGIMQQWMGRINGNKIEVTQLTNEIYDCYGNMPSRYEDGKPPRVAFTYNWPIYYAKAGWFYTNKPNEIFQVPGFDYFKMSMWSAVSDDFLFVYKPNANSTGQIAKSNSEGGTIKVLTNDGGEKDDAGFFKAPEFGGEICLMANVDNSKLAIYRDLKSADGYWTRVATLSIPADFPFKYISSPEIIEPASGVSGVSYFALLARKEKDKNSYGSIWILSLGKNINDRIVRRIDGGEISGVSSYLLEPEPFTGENEVYVYYNYYNPVNGEHGLKRASTGILLSATSIHEQPVPSEFKLNQNYPNPFNPSTVISYKISAYGHVSLKVYDVLGSEVATLVDEYKQPGNYSSSFSVLGSSFSSGVYFYQLKANTYIETKKMILIK